MLTTLKSKLVDDIVYEVDCQMVTVKEGADVDIGLSILSLPSTRLVILSRKVPILPLRNRRKPRRMVLKRSTML